MAGGTGLKVVARRDDGAYLVTVEGSPCALTVALDDDGLPGIWAGTIDAIIARGEWTAHSGALPAEVEQGIAAFVSEPGWCTDD